MKRTASLLAAIILLFGIIPVTHAYTAGKYIVTDDVVWIYSSPQITSEKTGEICKNTYIEITEIRNNTFGKTYIAQSGIHGWVPLEALRQVSAPEADENIKGIVIDSLPDKVIYEDAREELDLTGIKVSAVYKDESTREISAYNVYAPEMKAPGEKTIRITYSPDATNVYEAEFTVTVVRQKVKSISVTVPPKAQYLEHEKLDLSLLSITTEFEDPSENTTLKYDEFRNNPDYTVTGCHGEAHGSILDKGTHTFTVSYKYPDISCSFTVDVTPRKLISLTIIENPEKMTVYSNKEIPALDGLVLEAAYDNGETQEVYHYDCTAVCDPEKFIIGPGNEVRVYFGELFVSLSFRYSVAQPKKISIEYPRDENGNIFPFSYLKGEPIDLSGIRVRLVYTDETYEYVSDYTISDINYNTTGSQNINIIYEEFSEVITINITPYFSKGDITGDGAITAGDARQALRASVGLTTLSGMTLFAGDANRDGEITAADARLILRASVGLENLYLTI